MFSLLILSIPVGFLGSLTGLGGASILIPLLVSFGIPVKEAIASAMVSIIATSSGSASSYVREGIANVKVAMYLEMFTIMGAILGATITTIITPVYLYFFFAAFLTTSFLKLKRTGKDHLPPSEVQDRISNWLELQGSYFDEAKKQIIEYRVNHAFLGGIGMFVAGLAAGMLGIGAGAFKVTVSGKHPQDSTKSIEQHKQFHYRYDGFSRNQRLPPIESPQYYFDGPSGHRDNHWINCWGKGIE
jgi:uncharacterized membrane protein YfcA